MKIINSKEMAPPEAAQEDRKTLVGLEPELRCSMTLEPLKDARTLFCGHTHAAATLAALAAKTLTPKCLLCRVPFSDEVDALPKNLPLQEFADHLHQAFPDGPEAATDREVRAYVYRRDALKMPLSYSAEIHAREQAFHSTIQKGETEGFDAVWRAMTRDEIEAFLSYRNYRFFNPAEEATLRSAIAALGDALCREILTHENYRSLQSVKNSAHRFILLNRLGPADTTRFVHAQFGQPGTTDPVTARP